MARLPAAASFSRVSPFAAEPPSLGFASVQPQTARPLESISPHCRLLPSGGAHAVPSSSIVSRVPQTTRLVARPSRHPEAPPDSPRPPGNLPSANFSPLHFAEEGATWPAPQKVPKVEVFFPRRSPRTARASCVRSDLRSEDSAKKPAVSSPFRVAFAQSLREPSALQGCERQQATGGEVALGGRSLQDAENFGFQTTLQAQETLPCAARSSPFSASISFPSGKGLSVTSRPLPAAPLEFSEGLDCGSCEQLPPPQLPRLKADANWGEPGGPPVTVVSDGDLFECLQRQLEALRREPTVLASSSVRFESAAPLRGSSLEGGDWEYSVIQEGTFARVFAGRREEDGLALAIKVPGGALALQQPLQLLQRTLNEWSVLSRCQHPGVVPLVGAVVHGPLDVWLVTGRAPGEDLYALKQRRLQQRAALLGLGVGGCFSAQEGIRMCRSLARTVAYLHRPVPGRKGVVVHRDIKPENILVASDFSVRLCDFGDAQESVDGRTGRVTGATWLYAPPEVLRANWGSGGGQDGGETERERERRREGGGPCGEFDASWDVWSMGCVFVEMFGLPHPLARHLRGRPLDSASVYTRLRELALLGRLAPDIPEELGGIVRQVVQACLQDNPNNRPSAEQVVAALNAEDATILSAIHTHLSRPA